MNPSEIREQCRANFNIYLIQAFQHIPKNSSLKLLNMGCGTGVSDLFIASLTPYQITAIDIAAHNLEKYQQKQFYQKNQKRFTLIHGSVDKISLPEHSFDIILAEGLFNIIGFEQGFSLANQLLAPEGFIIIHDEFKDHQKKLEIFNHNGFILLESIKLDQQVWQEQYIECLKKNIKLFLTGKNTEEENEIRQIKSEIELFQQNPHLFQSIYYILYRDSCKK
ncbi:MAG: class I SAM-dependent methyltransferase [Spirochaetes bacterium]|nr:class I SAM-dependent methyltransferase [Spirochaetota bacterium]